MNPFREFLRPRVNKLMVGWVILALLAAIAFVVVILPYLRMPELSNTPWHELARGIVGGEGAHQPDSPYYVLATNESPPVALTVLKSRLASQGWRVDKDPSPSGGVTFVRINDPGTELYFGSFPTQSLNNPKKYSVAPDRLRDWQRQYAQIYILEMFFP